MDRYTLNVKRSESGLWFVTSPDDKGLLVMGHDQVEALSRVPAALADLQLAREMAGLTGEDLLASRQK